MQIDSTSVFLRAEWRYLAVLNYEVDPALLVPSVPKCTELDSWNGKTFVSVVGFLFLNTRVRGISIPFHRNFEEVNLRFYVRRKTDQGWRRGVVFIKELVPRFIIAFVARILYNEQYTALPMSHWIDVSSVEPMRTMCVKYSWQHDGTDNYLKLAAPGRAQQLREGSEEEFITEHYWGYSSQRDGSTLEYRVDHPRWQIWEVSEASLVCDVENLYGSQFVDSLHGSPASAFLADGSAVKIYEGTRLRC